MPIDRNSETWQAVAAHVDKELQANREMLEAPGTDQATTEGLRGRIRALRGVLVLAEAKPEFK